MDRILLIDSDPASRDVYGRALGAVPSVEVVGLESVREAQTALTRQSFGLVVSASKLSDGTAVDVVHRLAGTTTSLVVLALPNHLDEKLVEHLRRANASVLRAPTEPAQLTVCATQLLAERRLNLAPDSAFTVSDYLQLAGMARRSVIIHVTSGDLEGQIVVQNGTPVWARDRDSVGTVAFQRLALLPRAEINCQPCSTWSTKPNLDGSLEQLLLDAARQSDERRSSPRHDRANASNTDESAPGPSNAAQLQRSVPRPNPPPLRRERGDAPVTKDKPMTSDKPPESERILTNLPAISAIARADQEGSVLDFAGPFDAETACAVATIAARPITEIVAELGLGDLQSWCVSMGENTWYVVHRARQMYVAQGGASKNPTTVLKKVEAGCRGHQ